MDSPSSRDVAREAAVRQAVSVAVYLAMVVAINLAFTKRELIAIQLRRLAAWRRQDAARAATERRVAEFRREMSDYERGHTGGPPRAGEGGLYAPPA